MSEPLTLNSILRDMRKIPDKMCPLGKNAWLQEWADTGAKLEKLKANIQFLIETTQAENDKILVTVNEDQQCSDSQARAILQSSYYNNGYVSALQQILGVVKK